LSELSATLWWFTADPKPLKIQVFWGSPSPQGSHSPHILGDTTRPRHVTCVLVSSKSDRRRLRKTLHKQTNRQTNKQTNRHYENNGHLAVNQKPGNVFDEFCPENVWENRVGEKCLLLTSHLGLCQCLVGCCRLHCIYCLF